MRDIGSVTTAPTMTGLNNVSSDGKNTPRYPHPTNQALVICTIGVLQHTRYVDELTPNEAINSTIDSAQKEKMFSKLYRRMEMGSQYVFPNSHDEKLLHSIFFKRKRDEHGNMSKLRV